MTIPQIDVDGLIIEIKFWDWSWIWEVDRGTVVRICNWRFFIFFIILRIVSSSLLFLLWYHVWILKQEGKCFSGCYLVIILERLQPVHKRHSNILKFEFYQEKQLAYGNTTSGSRFKIQTGYQSMVYGIVTCIILLYCEYQD